MVRSARDRSKLDTGSDEAFYDSLRLVTHDDDAFLARLTELYAGVLEPGGRLVLADVVRERPDQDPFYAVVATPPR